MEKITKEFFNNKRFISPLIWLGIFIWFFGRGILIIKDDGWGIILFVGCLVTLITTTVFFEIYKPKATLIIKLTAVALLLIFIRIVVWTLQGDILKIENSNWRAILIGSFWGIFFLPLVEVIFPQIHHKKNQLIFWYIVGGIVLFAICEFFYFYLKIKYNW